MELEIKKESYAEFLRVSRLLPIIFLVLLAIVNATWSALLDLRFSGLEVNLFVFFVLLVTSLIYGVFRKNEALAEISYYSAIWSLAVPVTAELCYVFATLDLPLYDGLFAAADRRLGFDWLSVYKFVADHKVVFWILLVPYSSLLPQLFFSIVHFSHTGNHDRNAELFWLASISLVLTSAISGILPAAGAFYHFNIDLVQATHLHDYFALRKGQSPEFVLANMQGIITFPSYHTVAAILLTYVYRGMPAFRFILPINALVLVSTPFCGGHYLVDMIGGGAVALLAIVFTRALASFLLPPPQSISLSTEPQPPQLRRQRRRRVRLEKV